MVGVSVGEAVGVDVEAVGVDVFAGVGGSVAVGALEGECDGSCEGVAVVGAGLGDRKSVV